MKAHQCNSLVSNAANIGVRLKTQQIAVHDYVLHAPDVLRCCHKARCGYPGMCSLDQPARSSLACGYAMMYPHHCRVDRGVLRIKVLKYKELEKEPIIEEVKID